MKTPITLIIAALLLCLGCDQEPPPSPGEDGGECRIALTPCNEGLECRNGACLPGVSDEQSPEITLIFDFGENQAVADGNAAVLVTLLASRTADGSPYGGEILLHIDPPGAGELKPGLVSFDNGIGFTEYVTCERGRDRVCPSEIRLTAALPDAPLSPFTSSPRIALTDDAPDPDTNDEP